MPIEIIVAAATVSVGVALGVYALAVAPDRRNTIRRNLVVDGQIVDERELLLQESAVDRALVPAVRALAARARRLTPLAWVETLEHRIKLAGIRGRQALERTLALKLALGVAGLLGALYVLATMGATLLTLAGGAFLIFFGYVLPDVVLLNRARERQGLVRSALPDTLDQMTISVEAGLGFDAAMRRVAEIGEGPLAEELRHAIQEINLGLSRRQAFRNIVERTDVEELNQFAFAVQHADEYGLPIAHVLRVQAADLRIRRRQWAEEKALKIPVKILFPLVFCIFPTLFIVILAPAVLSIMRALF
jgi:tight adherence protein C